MPVPCGPVLGWPQGGSCRQLDRDAAPKTGSERGDTPAHEIRSVEGQVPANVPSAPQTGFWVPPHPSPLALSPTTMITGPSAFFPSPGTHDARPWT